MRGSHLEEIVRHSADRQADSGLWLVQQGPRFVGKVVGDHGEAKGRLVAPGALDFVGDYRGRLVTFDCKSTQIATSFPLENIKKHQAIIVRKAHARGAIAFFLVEFAPKARKPEYFALDWPTLAPWWKGYEGHKAGYPGYDDAAMSIPIGVFRERCPAIARTVKTLDLVSVIEALVGAERSPA